MDPLELLADLPSFKFFPIISDLFQEPGIAFERGIFQEISSAAIDLPAPRPPVDPEKSNEWIRRMRTSIQNMFTNEAPDCFTAPLNEFIQSGEETGTLPIPRICAAKGEYSLFLDKAEKSGMLSWSIVEREEPTYTNMANTIQMTLFAVSKTKERSRLISWPRVQNEGMPDPPYTSLPDPSLFESISVKGSNPAAFYLDVSNMFHNIIIPNWMAQLFPMKPIPLNMLSEETVARIKQRMEIPKHQEGILMRPFQATMPMGYKWSVYIGHTFAGSCLRQAFHIFKSSRIAPKEICEVVTLNREEAPFIITEQSPLLLHIIDDIAEVSINWSHDAVSLWYRLTRNILRLAGLPVSETKSCPKDKVATTTIKFIGCEWDLQEMVIYPAPNKLVKVTKQVTEMLSSRTATRHALERFLGRLIWFANLNRPLLACTQSVFRITINKEMNETFTLNETCKKELRMLVALLPLAKVELSLPLINLLIAFDASETAGAVVFTFITHDLATMLWIEAQQARHNPTIPPCRNLGEVQKCVSQYKWKKALVHYWTKREHINGLEAATAVLALEWLVRARVEKSRTLMLTDSLATLGALHKGRSSAPGMLVRCRRFGALALANQLKVIAYVMSKDNPADRYTRL